MIGILYVVMIVITVLVMIVCMTQIGSKIGGLYMILYFVCSGIVVFSIYGLVNINNNCLEEFSTDYCQNNGYELKEHGSKEFTCINDKREMLDFSLTNDETKQCGEAWKGLSSKQKSTSIGEQDGQ